MPAARGTAPLVRRPAYESLQGRKPRLRERKAVQQRYGDLTAAGELLNGIEPMQGGVRR
jgi:hypothetical protein